MSGMFEQVLQAASAAAQSAEASNELHRLVSLQGGAGLSAALSVVTVPPADTGADESRPAVRLLCAIALKNATVSVFSDHSRKQSQDKEVHEQAQAHLRRHLCSAVLQALLQCPWLERRVHVQLGALLAKLARRARPGEWPELFPQLVGAACAGASVDSNANTGPSASASAGACSTADLEARVRAGETLLEVLLELTAEGRVGLPVPQRAIRDTCSSALPQLLAWFADASAALRAALPVAMPATSSVPVPGLPMPALTQLAAVGGGALERVQALAFLVGTATKVCRSVLLLVLPTAAASDGGGGAAASLSLFGADGFFPKAHGLLSHCLLFLRAGQQELRLLGLNTFLAAEDNAEGEAEPRKRLLLAVHEPVLELASLVLHLQEVHSQQMLACSGPFLDLALTELHIQCGKQAEGGLHLPPLPFCSHALLLLAAALANPHCASAALAVLSPDRLEGLLELCFTRLLRYDRQELADWTEDPEALYAAQQAEAKGDNLRTAAESLLLSLLGDGHGNEAFTAAIIPRLVGMLMDLPAQQKMLACSASAVARPGGRRGAAADSAIYIDADAEHCYAYDEADTGVLLWDAVYTVAGLGAWQCGEAMEGHAWLQTVLFPLFSILCKDSRAGVLGGVGGQQLLLRRLLWLLRCWFFQFAAETHTGLLSLAMHHLGCGGGPGLDLLVRVEACLLVETGMQAGCFGAALLAPVIVPLVRALGGLVVDLHEPELQRTVCSVIAEVMQNAGVVEPAVQAELLAVNGGLWEHLSGGEAPSPVRAAVLDVLRHVVQAGRTLPVALLQQLVPLLAQSCSGQDEGGALLQSGLALWLAVLWSAHAQDYTSCALLLLPQCLMGLLANATPTTCGGGEVSLLSLLEQEELSLLLKIIEACAVSSGGAVLLHASQAGLAAAYAPLLLRSGPALSAVVARPLLAFFLVCPEDTSVFLAESGLLSAPIRSCLAADPGAIGASFAAHAEPDVTLVYHGTLVAWALFNRYDTTSTQICHVLREAKPSLTSADIAYACSAAVQALAGVLLAKFEVCAYVSGGAILQRVWLALLCKLRLQPAHCTATQALAVESLARGFVERTKAEAAPGSLLQDADREQVTQAAMALLLEGSDGVLCACDDGTRVLRSPVLQQYLRRTQSWGWELHSDGRGGSYHL